MERPDYVPNEIWQAARTLLDWQGQDIDYKKYLSNLLFDGQGQSYASELANTWPQLVTEFRRSHQRLLESLDGRGDPDPDDAYRIFLTILSELPLSLDQDLKPALADFGGLLKAVQTAADDLASAWGDLMDLRERKSIQWATEHELLREWLSMSDNALADRHWRHDDPKITDLLTCISSAAKHQPATPPATHEYAAIGNGGVSGHRDISAMVRRFDSVADIYRTILVGVHITDAVLAKLLSALLRRDVSRLAVHEARTRNTCATE